MSFFGKIDFNELSDADRSIYHYMSSNSDKIPYMRVREIASESHTSASSVMRFIRKLGYESFSEFKRYFKNSEDKASLKHAFEMPVLKEEDFTRDLEGKLIEIAEKILECENVIFFGIGASGAMCEYATRRLSILGCNAFAMTDATYPLASKLKNTSDNMLIALSVTGMTTEILEMVNGFRHKEDISIVAITSDVNSTLATMAEYVLDYRVDVHRSNYHDDLTSQMPCLFLIESLSNVIARIQ